jgi:hypothetical protein
LNISVSEDRLHLFNVPRKVRVGDLSLHIFDYGGGFLSAKSAHRTRMSNPVDLAEPLLPDPFDILRSKAAPPVVFGQFGGSQFYMVRDVEPDPIVRSVHVMGKANVSEYLAEVPTTQETRHRISSAVRYRLFLSLEGLCRKTRQRPLVPTPTARWFFLHRRP